MEGNFVLVLPCFFMRYIYIFMVEQVRCEIVEIISIKRNLTSIVKKEYCFLIIIDEL